MYEVGEEANDVLMFVYCRNTSRVQRERVVNLILIPILIVLRVMICSVQIILVYLDQDEGIELMGLYSLELVVIYQWYYLYRTQILNVHTSNIKTPYLSLSLRTVKFNLVLHDRNFTLHNSNAAGICTQKHEFISAIKGEV